jgi:hypothetical protein
MTGEALSTGGKGAHGDLAGVGGAGALATNVGFSGAPFNTRLLPDAMRLGLTDGEALALPLITLGAGDLGFSTGTAAGIDAGTGMLAPVDVATGSAGAVEGVG